MGLDGLQETKREMSKMRKNFGTKLVYRFVKRWSTCGLFLLFIFNFLIISNVFANEATLKTIIQAYQKPGITIGVQVNKAKDKSQLFSYNANKSFNPASVMKVVTSTAALTYLGGSFEYKTSFTTDSFSRGIIHNLYIKGVGDPSLVEERLWRIAKDLRVRGVKKIEGDIIIDNSLFDSFNFSGKENGSTRAYNASISPFAINFNSFAIVAKNYGGGVMEVHIDPPTHYFDLKSNIRPSGNHISIARSYKGGKEYVNASGGVSREKIKYANASNPLQYAGSTLVWVLNQMGIEFNGKIKQGKAPGAKKIVVDKSKPLSLIIRDLNKFSNNFTAEMILKTMAAKKTGVPGTTAKGASLLKSFVTSLGVDSNEFAIFNGSGLSRNNRLSPNSLNHVLLAAYKNNKIRSDFIASLSIAGTDGTLKSRLKSAGLLGNVKAKTGTLHDVSSLSGFLQTKNKNMVAFTILVNGSGVGSGSYFGMQEKLLMDIYKSF